MDSPDFIEWRIIKNPISGIRDTVIGKRKQGDFMVEEAVLVDNPVYLQSDAPTIKEE